MPPHMICVLPFLSSKATIRYLRISLPLIEPLIDNERYFLPGDLPAAAGDQLRAMCRPRLTRAGISARTTA